MNARQKNVLFLCTGNSARSILAEALLTRIGGDRFRAFSAGSRPTGKINPYAVQLLEELGFDASQFHSKSWDEFSGRDAPRMDYIFTVCDSAASESCPVWAGHPMTIHWGIPDPAAANAAESAIREAFDNAYATLRYRLNEFVSLPLDEMNDAERKEVLRSLGQATTASKDRNLL